MITAICQCDNDGLTAFYPIFGPEAFRVTHGLGVASRDDRVHPPRDQHGEYVILVYSRDDLESTHQHAGPLPRSSRS